MSTVLLAVRLLDTDAECADFLAGLPVCMYLGSCFIFQHTDAEDTFLHYSSNCMRVLQCRLGIEGKHGM